MSAPEAPDTAFDTASVSVITTAPEPSTRVLDVRKRFTELDGLRGVAALFVVIFHLNKYIRDLELPRPIDQVISGGYLMVDLFFVLSGFVLARSMLATRTSGDVFRFSSLRARRFLPLHLTGVAIALCTVTLTWVAQHYHYQYAPDRPAFGVEAESAWGYVSSMLLLQGFIGPHYAGYAAAWSLSIELWTNVLLVVAIAAVPWVHRKQWVGPAAVAFGTLVLFMSAGVENAIGWTAFGRGLTGLGTGMVIYWAYTAAIRYRPVRWPAIGAALGLIGLVGCMYLANDVRRLEYLPILVIAAGLIFCLVQPSDGPSHRLLNSGVAQWLGSRSFALYALHGPVMLVVSLLARFYGLHLHQPKVAIVIIIVTLIGALSAAEIGHRFIERLWVPKKSG